MANTFIAPGQIISGSRTLDMAADTMAKMGKKALVVTDDVMKNLCALSVPQGIYIF